MTAFAIIILLFFIFCGILSIAIGMLGAFNEKNIKRFFVYSSRGHVGFRLIGISLLNLESAFATFSYLWVYIISSFIR